MTFSSVEVNFKPLLLCVLPTVTQFTKCNYLFPPPPHLATSAMKSTSRCGRISVKLVDVKAAAGGLGAVLNVAACSFVLGF
jgi:hypothetical protein